MKNSIPNFKGRWNWMAQILEMRMWMEVDWWKQFAMTWDCTGPIWRDLRKNKALHWWNNVFPWLEGNTELEFRSEHWQWDLGHRNWIPQGMCCGVLGLSLSQQFWSRYTKPFFHLSSLSFFSNSVISPTTEGSCFLLLDTAVMLFVLPLYFLILFH